MGLRRRREKKPVECVATFASAYKGESVGWEGERVGKIVLFVFALEIALLSYCKKQNWAEVGSSEECGVCVYMERYSEMKDVLCSLSSLYAFAVSIPFVNILLVASYSTLWWTLISTAKNS